MTLQDTGYLDNVQIDNVQIDNVQIDDQFEATIAETAADFVVAADDALEPRVWRNSAACRDTDPDLFFPVGQTGPAIGHIASARAVCNTCAVQRECLEYALMTNQDAGIWGGTTEDERRKIRRERRKQRAKSKII